MNINIIPTPSLYFRKERFQLHFALATRKRFIPGIGSPLRQVRKTRVTLGVFIAESASPNNTRRART